MKKRLKSNIRMRQKSLTYKCLYLKMVGSCSVCLYLKILEGLFCFFVPEDAGGLFRLSIPKDAGRILFCLYVP